MKTRRPTIRVTVTARGVSGFPYDPVEIELPSGSTVATILDLVFAAKRGSLDNAEPSTPRNAIATLNGRYVPLTSMTRSVC